MDSRLSGEYPVELAYSMAEIAGKCVAVDLNDRPSISEVFATLSKILSSSLDWDPSDELEHSRSLSHGR
ncbi:putative non-specific serine/threonine protein kinase [Helianthus annuus]|nr:putative non-specific serine/threonine protein kinase [Helianthus annuus]